MMPAAASATTSTTKTRTPPIITVTDPTQQADITRVENEILRHFDAAIDNLIKLAIGVSIDRETEKGRTETYIHPPDRRACEYLLNHALGMPGANHNTQQTNQDPYVVPPYEVLITMTPDELLAIYEKQRARPATTTPAQTTNQRFAGPIERAKQKIMLNLPKILQGLSLLGAGTIATQLYPGGPIVFHHPPDKRAIKYLIKRILGAPGTLIAFPETKSDAPIPSPEEPKSYAPDDERIVINTAVIDLPAPAIAGAAIESRSPNPDPRAGTPSGNFDPRSMLLAKAHQKVTEYAAAAVYNLSELVQGILIRKGTFDNPINFQLPPDYDACEYIATRILGPIKAGL